MGTCSRTLLTSLLREALGSLRAVQGTATTTRGPVPASPGAARAPGGKDKRGLLWTHEERARESKQSKGLSLARVTAVQPAE